MGSLRGRLRKLEEAAVHKKGRGPLKRPRPKLSAYFERRALYLSTTKASTSTLGLVAVPNTFSCSVWVTLGFNPFAA